MQPTGGSIHSGGRVPKRVLRRRRLRRAVGAPVSASKRSFGAELGADIVKSNWPGSAEEFHEIVEAVPVPVVVAGGSRESDLDLSKIASARSAGASAARWAGTSFNTMIPKP